MKSKKLLLSSALIICLLFGTLSGCSTPAKETTATTKGNDSTTTTTKAEATTTQSDTTTAASKAGALTGKLVIWEHTPQFEDPLKAVINGFKAKNPGVDIEYQIKTTDQYYNLLATTIQAGETPDLFWTNGNATSNYPSYVGQGVLMDITDKVDLSLFNDDTKKIVTIDNKIYASPTAEVGGRAVFYNQEIFDKLGLAVPKTFSEFEALLPVILDAGIIPISFSGSDPWAILFQFEPVLAAMSLDWLKESATTDVHVNDARVATAYDKMLEWAGKGYYGKGFVGVDEGGALLAFSKGEAAMCIEGTWNILTIQQNNPSLKFGAFQIPTEDGTRPFVGTSACGLSISANTENPDAAVAFLNYFASLEGQTLWVNTLNAIPGVKGIASKDPIINEIADYDVMAPSFYDILGKLAAEGENPGKVWEEDQAKVMSKGISVKDFLDSLASMTTSK